MLLLLHGVLSPLWPRFCFILLSLPSAAARPRLAPSPADRAAAAQAEASLQKSTGMFLIFSAEPENTFGPIQRHSIAVFSKEHYLYMNNKKKMELTLWIGWALFLFSSLDYFLTLIHFASNLHMFFFFDGHYFTEHIDYLLSDWPYFILLKKKTTTIGRFYYQADRHCTSNK